MSQTACETAWPIKSSFRTWSNTRGGESQFTPGQYLSEEAADVGEGDDDNVARVGDFVAEQHAHDPQLDFALGPAVNDRVAARAEHPEEAIIRCWRMPAAMRRSSARARIS